MTYGCHIYQTESDMAMAKMCTYPPSQHELPHWKCVLRCCEDCLCIDIPSQESDDNHSQTSPEINFHVYKMVSRCTVNGRRPPEKNICCVLLRPNLHQLLNYTQEKKRACNDGYISL